MTARNEATQTQITAAQPDRSTWLEANAGSGKTRVLTDRVARLLLGGVDPQHILCLTYTKAAATEMQNRLFNRLGAWAMKDSKTLEAELRDLGVEGIIGPDDLRESRRLFAKAIEAPGGLKIQTIHSFCASLLRRFPREAGVSPQFTEMDDRTATLLRQEVLDDMAQGPHKGLIHGLAQHYTGEDFDALTGEILRYRDVFHAVPELAECLRWMGQPSQITRDSLVADVFQGGEAELIGRWIPRMLASGGNNEKAANKLLPLTLPSFEALAGLEAVLLTGKGAKEPFSAKIDAFPTKPLRTAHPEDTDALNALMARVEGARVRRLRLMAAEKTHALYAFAHHFLSAYDARKQARGWLDFDDLIRRTRTLLTEPAVAQWVLFRLDGGIDHILVDEAQDTSPVQWAVIEKLAQEFTSGEGARADVTRTLFVVGDKKQSIYSFQGADPRAFDEMRRDFGQRLAAVGTPLQEMEMQFSFRSSPAVLQLVDTVFDSSHSDAIGQASHHRAFKSTLPGRVDLWPQVPRSTAAQDEDWTDPVDLPADDHHTVVLARAIADQIQTLLRSGETIPDEIDKSPCRRPVQPGDIMILVKGRKTGLFHQIIQACKERSLPIAGADRLRVGAELAVRDIAALLSFLALQDDDLSLACALKSPLFGWSEQQLFTLAHNRGPKTLWQRLKAQPETYSDTLTILNDLRNRADFLRPFELIERILTTHNGRDRLLGRLGLEAEDGIDALLSQALAFENTHVPSLTEFLVWMQTDDLEIKRQTSSEGGLIRVMTVHGAKGLEAPIVILPDTTPPPAQFRPELLPDGDRVYWKTKTDDMPEAMAHAKSEAIERQNAEYLRLLYVAMTRAEKWLIVAGVEKPQASASFPSWYDLVSGAIQTLPTEDLDTPTGPGRRYAFGQWEGLEAVHPQTTPNTPVQLAGWTQHPAPKPLPLPETLNPSGLGGAKALPSDLGLPEDLAKDFGTAVHLLLEHLPPFPPAQRAAEAPRILATEALDLPPNLVAEATAHALTTLSAPNLQHLFAPETLAEVPFTAQIDGRPVYGVIDRLIIEKDTVTVVDFKTNRAVPEAPDRVPEGLLRQMGAYAAALAQIYPGKTIATAILWTASASLMPLPADLTAAALTRRETA
jgi:ATP-dependent helicase/nuclease subunit A